MSKVSIVEAKKEPAWVKVPIIHAETDESPVTYYPNRRKNERTVKKNETVKVSGSSIPEYNDNKQEPCN